MLEPRPEMRTATRFLAIVSPGQVEAPGVIAYLGHAGLSATTLPSRATVSPASVHALIAASAPSGSSTATIPIPQLKVRSISGPATPPTAASQRNTGRALTRAKVELDAEPLRDHARDVVGESRRR